MKVRPLVLSAIILGLCSCSTMYYGAMEKLGVHKRDIMVDRVKAAHDTQNEAKQQFLTGHGAVQGPCQFSGRRSGERIQ